MIRPREQPKADNLNQILTIYNQANGNAALYLYGEIVWSRSCAWDDSDQWPEKIKTFLNGLTGQPLDIYVNSPGGSVFAGLAIYNQLTRYAGAITSYVDGIAASIASVISLAADKVVMPSNTQMMIHKAECVSWGNAGDLRKAADMLDKADESIMLAYEAAGAVRETIQPLIEAETYLTAQEAAGLFPDKIEIVGGNQAVACALKMGPAKDLYDNMMELESERLRLHELTKGVIAI